MPYAGRFGGPQQAASKISHHEFVRNPEILEFLGTCDYMREPSAEQTAEIRAMFVDAPSGDGSNPAVIVAIDGSAYESAFRDGFPNTRAGYIKISAIAVNVDRWTKASNPQERYIDPFKMAAVFDAKNSLTLCLPSSNVRYGGEQTVKDGFRRRIFEEFMSERTRIGSASETFLNTLYRLAEMGEGRGTHRTSIDSEDGRPRGGRLAGGDRFIRIHHCSSCGARPPRGFPVPETPGHIVCSTVAGAEGCDSVIFATDALRLHESVTDQSPNSEALTRTMSAVESILLAHLILHLADHNPTVLSKMCFMYDGPLAIFGQPAWLHGCMLRMCHYARGRLAEANLPNFLLMGFQKGGQVADHAAMLAPFLRDPSAASQAEIVLPVSDGYRNEYIREQEDKGINFGDETYWGQDFLFRDSSGELMVVALPYPVSTKRPIDPRGERTPEAYFRELKAEIGNYPDLGRSLDVVRAFRSALFGSSLVPVIAAHAEASISLMPGGRVLDLLALDTFARQRVASP